MKEARYYEPVGDGKVKCGLCRHRCVIGDGATGLCAVRRNEKGVLYALTYGRCVARHLDPIEKKPLFHFLPGSSSYSVAAAGCNFRCAHCQNYEISQRPRTGRIIGEFYAPERIVADAAESAARSISYTYTEPTIFFEYAFDTAVIAAARDLKNVFVTNGYTEEQPLADIRPYLDAANVDLKAFSEEFYRTVCGAKLQGVLDTLVRYRAEGIWLEVTTLVIPGYNDTKEELRDIARFIRNELGAETPWHVSAFYPTYKLTDAPPTPPSTIRMARDTGQNEGLLFVYTGNIAGDGGETTICPGCGKDVIERRGFSVVKNSLAKDACGSCGRLIPGVWA